MARLNGQEDFKMTLKGKHMIKSIQRLAARLARTKLDSVDLYYLGRTLRQLTAAVDQACTKNGIDLDSDTLPTPATVEPSDVAVDVGEGVVS